MVRHRQDPQKRDTAMTQVQELSIDVIKAKLAHDSPQYPTFPQHLDRSLTIMHRSLEESRNPQECRVVIDLGTARFYLVYSLPGSERLHEVHDWDCTGTQEYDQPITFTVLYYLPESRKKFWNGRRYLWGREVDHERRTLITRREELDPRRLVRFFKPAIHKTKTANWYDKKLNEQANYIFGDTNAGVKQFALDFMSRVYEHLFHPDKGHIARKQAEFGFQMNDVIMVFTMPSGWPIPEYEIFQQPAEKWGLRQTQIQYVSESDGAIRYWISKEGWRIGAIKTNSIVVNVDIGAGTIVSLSFCTNYTFELLTGKDISIKKITYFNKCNPETSRMENALPQRGLDHGIERIVKIFEENILSRLNDYPLSDAQVMAKCAADHFREKWNNFENGDFFDLPLLPEGEEFFVTRDELTGPYETAISAVVEVLEGIQQDLAKLGYGDRPMVQCILLSGGGTAHTILVDALKNWFPKIPFHCMPSAELKKGCAKGGFLESLDRTNFTQHKFARASYGIKGRQPCSTPDNDHEELSPEEVRMLQLDPTAEKIYDKDLQRFLFKKDVNDWFAKLHDPLIWNPENFVWRDQVVRCQDDLDFSDILVEYNGHPGPGGFTIYDEEKELYKLEFIQVNLCAHVKHKDLKRANEKKKDYDTKLLEYCYSVEQNEEGSPIFFVIFRPHRKAKEFKKMQVYPTCVLNVGRLEGHRNLEDPSLSISDSPCSAASNSPLLATQLKRIQEQCGLITDSESSSPPNSQNNHAGFTVLSVKNHPDDSASQHNISSDTTSSSLELQATPTVAQVASQYSLTQLPRRGKSKSGVRQKPVGPSFVDESSISRPSELGTSTPLIDKTSWPHQGTRADLENIEICQQPVLNRRSNRKADSNSKANREPLSSIDLNINSRGTRIQIQTSLLPRPKKVGFADIANKLRS